jgi:class 3 adenylate cyclase
VRVPPTSRDEVGELTRAFNEMGDSLEQKHKIQQAFGRYVDDYVLNQLLENDADEKQAGIEREVTILFVDIRQFTRLSEGMKANDVVGLLNECFQLISDLILERGRDDRQVHRRFGDGLLRRTAAAGRPRAARGDAAIEIARGVERRNAQIAAADGRRVPISIGIGIHTGVVVVGNIGSDRRSDFTAVGDAVNVAHRLEKLARPGEILVSEAVQRQARGAARLRFEGERQLSGREEPVHVYSVELGPSGARGGGRGGRDMTPRGSRAAARWPRAARSAARCATGEAASCSTARATCAARSRAGAPPTPKASRRASRRSSGARGARAALHRRCAQRSSARADRRGAARLSPRARDCSPTTRRTSPTSSSSRATRSRSAPRCSTPIARSRAR